MKKNYFLIILFLSSAFFSCKKDIRTADQQQTFEYGTENSENLRTHSKQTNTYSSEVAIKWINMQLQLMRTASGIPNVAFSRPYAYSGIVLYETVAEGVPYFSSLAGQLSGLSDLPKTDHHLSYHWPAAANAALAFINKNMFPGTSDANKNAIDSLENALNIKYSSEANFDVINRSISFGKAIAQKVFEWSQTDGYLQASDPYSPPTGTGLWVSTPPALAKASTPFWGNIRTMVTGSADNSQPGEPTVYSEDPSSDFYKMAKEVYDASSTLTPEQTAMALYWRDIPGVTSPGHWESILLQVIEKDGSRLDKAALAYALSGIVLNDACISCWKTKYHYNLVRPITYIRNVLGYTSWNSLLSTPAHPEYSSAHAVLSAATAEALSLIFGEDYSFTDHTYDYLGMAPRAFSSFRKCGEDAGNSRLYAGIHYQPSINTGLWQGRRVAHIILNTIRFRR